MKRYIDSVENNGYTIKIVTPLNCEAKSLKNDINKYNINWFNFDEVDSYYDDEEKEYIVLSDHDNKIIKLIVI